MQKNKIPTLSEFLGYAKEICEEDGYSYSSIEKSLKSKYRAWKEAGWKKQRANKFIPIKIWKTTLSNTLPYLKAEKIEVQGAKELQSEFLKNRYGIN